jgi:hypothetical protein
MGITLSTNSSGQLVVHVESIHSGGSCYIGEIDFTKEGQKAEP